MTLYEYDRSLGIDCFCGVDEAGRGPWAGDVYAAAVILPLDAEIPGINDSKQLSEKKREALYDQIMEQAVAASVAKATAEEIDRLNILQATFLAMGRAVEGLTIRPKFALIDGNRNPKLSVPSRCLVKGDAVSASIAAASILAKVSRDRSMVKLAQTYPQYAFEQHKGYGTKLHQERLDEYGISPIHRMSFLKKYLAAKGNALSLAHGQLGEETAAEFLGGKGCSILERNYRRVQGEIDIIAQKGDFLIFCEVKTRLADSLVLPREAVTAGKQRKIIATALDYLAEHPSELQPRFDVIEVTLSPEDGAVLSVEQTENAFVPEQQNGGREYGTF